MGLVAALVALGLSLGFAATAAAEVRSGSATDGTEPERIPGSVDIVGVAASYDTAGSLSVAVTTLAPPPVPTEVVVLGVRFGVLSGSECVSPVAAIVGSYTQPAEVAWGTTVGPKGAGTESISGNTTTLSAADAALANQPFNCVEPAIYKVGEKGGLVEPALEGLTAPITLVGPPPPAPPTPAPTAPGNPTPPPPAPTPPPKPNLVIPSKTVTLHRSAWKKVTVKITNTGNAPAAKVAVKVGKAKGVAIKPKSGKLKVKAIAAGKSKAASFKVMLTRKAKATSSLTLSVTGSKSVKASASLTLNAWTKPSPKKGKKEREGQKPTPPAPPPLAEKIFYRIEMQPSESARLVAYTFIDGTWAYTGMPSGGLPNCTTTTGGAETEGCVKYTYDPSSGAVQLESVGSGKIGSDGYLQIGEKTYSPTVIPAAGTTLQVEQEYAGFSGLCGPFSTCSTWHEYLTLTSSGEFVLSRQSLTTSDGPGSFVAAGSYPPGQHGTYGIEERGRIKLNFADGTSQTKTIAILLNKEGKPDPVNEGLLLDSTYFTFAHAG